MAKTEAAAQPVRQFSRLDSIAESRRADAVRALERELAVSEQVIMPLNPGGWQDPGRAHMLSEVAMGNAAKLEQLREIEALEGDELVTRYCQDCLAEPAGGITIDGVPLGRGGVPSSFAPE